VLARLIQRRVRALGPGPSAGAVFGGNLSLTWLPHRMMPYGGRRKWSALSDGDVCGWWFTASHGFGRPRTPTKQHWAGQAQNYAQHLTGPTHILDQGLVATRYGDGALCGED
jgi:hypothetical protein